MYIVLEIQKNEQGKVSVLPFTYEDSATAENKYHTILAYAAVSTVPVHTVAMMNEMAVVLKYEYYEHPVPEPEPEPEPVDPIPEEPETPEPTE